MEKLKLGVIYGGMSTENKVSCVSGASVIKNLNKEKYDITPIYIDENGNWFEVKNLDKNEKIEIDNVMKFLKKFDVVFPVLHGLYGEDGTIQGIFELFFKYLTIVNCVPIFIFFATTGYPANKVCVHIFDILIFQRPCKFCRNNNPPC